MIGFRLRLLFIRLWFAWLRWLRERNSQPAMIPFVDKIDWFIWESSQIQRNGYVFWFDHWRYPDAIDPTPEQRREVFRMSLSKARRSYGPERLNHIVSQAIAKLTAAGFTEQQAFERVQHMGQDPVQWAIDLANEKNEPTDFYPMHTAENAL